jgi:hypothetical protein
MCVIMCATTGILSFLLWKGGALAGYANPTRQYPEASAFVLAIILTLVMIAWMGFRGHDQRSTLEMASTSLFAFIPLIALDGLGAVPKSSLYFLECGLACALMLIPMFYRFGHYSGHHAAHQHQDQPAYPTEAHLHHIS